MLIKSAERLAEGACSGRDILAETRQQVARDDGWVVAAVAAEKGKLKTRDLRIHTHSPAISAGAFSAPPRKLVFERYLLESKMPQHTARVYKFSVSCFRGENFSSSADF
jgi:hypothetical protein